MILYLCTSALAKKKERTTNFNSITILQLHRLGHRLLIHSYRSFPTCEEEFPFLAFDNCMEIRYGLVAK